MHYVTLITHHSFHAKQNSILILSFLPQSVNGTTYHNQQEMPNHSSIRNQTSNSKTQANDQLQFRSTNQPNTSLPLRLGCSSLNHDLYRKNIIHSPLCTCGQIETQAHYLLHCPNNIVHRHQYYRNLHNNCQQFTILR